MDLNFLNSKNNQNKGKKGKEGMNLSSSIAGGIFLLMLITALYLVVSGMPEKVVSDSSISDLAKSVSEGVVKKIVVEGESLTITYTNDEIKKSKKRSRFGPFSNPF
jgi:hypothetical protein